MRSTYIEIKEVRGKHNLGMSIPVLEEDQMAWLGATLTNIQTDDLTLAPCCRSFHQGAGGVVRKTQKN